MSTFPLSTPSHCKSKQTEGNSPFSRRSQLKFAFYERREEAQQRLQPAQRPQNFIGKIMLSACVELMNAFEVPSILVGPNERVIHVNPAAETLFGAGLGGRHYITALRQPTLLDCIEIVLTDRRDESACDFLATDAGRDTTYRVKSAAVRLESGRHVLLYFEDKTLMEEAGQMRRDFVANVSHELRTPLTAMMGFIETLRGAAKSDPDAQARFLSIMEHEARRMNRLVQDLLSLSRVEAEARMRPKDKVDISGLVKSVVLSLKPIAEDAGADLQVVGADAEVFVPGDADQLSQVFTNLLENAIKYGGDGNKVTVSLERRDHEPVLRGQAVVVTVSDNGEGFDPIHIPRLTERFYRIDSHRSREMGGTGLGLAIVKHIVNRHRGRFRIESQPGQGSRFAVILATD